MTEDLEDLFGRNPPTRPGDLDGAPHGARAQRSRNRRIMGAVEATVAVTVVLAVGLAGQRLLSASPDPAAPATSVPALGSLGSLAYAVNGDIYVAKGTNKVRIADGAPGPEGYCVGYWGEGPIWSPDGRYLAFRGDGGKGLPGQCDRTVNITDATGRRLASFPAEGWAITWSPDSTRVAAWVDFYPGTMIGIYGIDGERQALVTVPPGLTLEGDFDPVWAPDGKSLLVPYGVEIPVDGSPSRQLPADDPRSQWRAMYSPDGAQVAYISRDEVTTFPEGVTTLGDEVSTFGDGVNTSHDEVPDTLGVAAADGSHARVLVPRGVENAVWSPTGDRIAFASVTSGKTVYVDPATELDIVDVASGTVTPLVRGGSDALTAIEFSPEGGHILYSRRDANNGRSLWSIHVDGSDPHLLVPGTSHGDWQASSPAR